MTAYDPALLTSHGYNWPDLREVAIGTRDAGGVLFKPDAGEAYGTAPDGRVQGLWMAYELRGTAWEITARDGDTYTVTRHDGQASQTFSAPPEWKTLAVVVERCAPRAGGRRAGSERTGRGQ